MPNEAFEMKVPNAETLQALQELEDGHQVTIETLTHFKVSLDL
jgi:hypothetical protein